MNPLKIGTDAHGNTFALPLDLVTQTIAILARKGKGKSYLADVFAEELLEAGQIPVVIDPTGAHWGLKSSADGNKVGYSIVVFGGEHADLPLEETAGELIARAIVENRFPAILDVSLLRKGASHRFLAAFLETLYRLNRHPLHLICDEADDYAPQRPFGDEARVLGAMEDIVRRGRIKGIGCTLVTQRPQVINKNVLTQAEMLVTLNMGHPKDIDAIKEWIAVHGDEKQAEAMIASLPALERGTAWFWAPGWGNLFECVIVRLRRTFNSGATPKPGETIEPPKKLASVDVAKLGKEIAATAQRAKENSPDTLKARIRNLESDLKKTAMGKAVATAPESKQQFVALERRLKIYRSALESAMKIIAKINYANFKGAAITPEEIQTALNAAVAQVGKRAEAKIADVQKQIERLQLNAERSVSELKRLLDGEDIHISVEVAHNEPFTVTPVKTPRASVPTGAINGNLTGPQQAIVDVVAMLGVRGIEANRDSVARWLSIHPNGGSYGTNLGFLRSNGYLESFRLTEKGQSVAREMQTGFDAALLPLEGGQRNIMEILRDGSPFTRDTLAEALGIHPNGGSYGTNLGRLRTMGLITNRGEIKLTQGANE